MATYSITNLPSNYSPGDIINCPYSGSERTITLPEGTFKLECWGGRGSCSIDNANAFGGYSYGNYQISASTTLYLNAGGAGNGQNGGYNGGGWAGVYGGGGASHIATMSGILSSLESYKSTILIVAGGSGGASRGNDDAFHGGAGGGATGGDGLGSYGGYGGTQSSGGGTHTGAGSSKPTAGTFGQGGQGNKSSGNSYAGGGGGGYYGGGGGHSYKVLGVYAGAGGGGSGYVNTSALTSSATTQQSSSTNPDTSAYAGYIRITVISLGTYTVSATAGTNVLAASVSASSVTSGTPVTFSCCLAHGATFDGWYNSSTRVSTSQTYTATITANTTLTAKASSTITRSRYIRYGDTTKYSDTQTGSIAIGYGSTIATLTGNESKTLVCSGKYMSYNVTVGNKTLSCSNKIASDNINVYYSAPSLTFNKSIQNGSNTLIDLSGWCVTDYLEVPSGYTYWEINHGGTHSSGSCFNEYDANKAYKSYWGASSNPRQNRFDYPNDTRYVRCTFKMDNLKNCYFRVSKNSDYSNPVYLFRGANV